MNFSLYKQTNTHLSPQEKFEYTKGVIKSRKSKKNRQYNDQRKRTNNDLQNTTHKTKNRATRTPLKTQMRLEGKLNIWYPSLYSCYKHADNS